MKGQAFRITRQLRGTISGAVGAIGQELIVRLAEANPKETLLSSTNWIGSVGAKHSGIAGILGARRGEHVADPGPQHASYQALAGYDLARGDVHVANNVFYLKELMDGSSPQAPAGWVQGVIDLVVEHAERIYARIASVRRVR